MNELSINPYESQRAVESASARALQSRENSEVLALLLGARQNPRDPIKACDRIRNAFTRVGLAEDSQYSFQRGGTDIAGPSIRAAEAIRLDWGNMATGWRELSRSVGTDNVGVSEIEAYAVDYETTNREAITFQVRHWRDTKRGGYALNDERDVYEICANQAQRRKRACILALIPSDVTAMAMDQASVTLRSKADTSPEAMTKMVEAFAPFGITKDHIEARIQRRLDAITAAQVVQLKRIYASLRDGISEPAQWFELAPAADGDGVITPPGPKTSAADAVAARRAAKQKAAKDAADKAATKGGNGPQPVPALVRYLAALENAPDGDAAALIVDEARSALNEDELRQLGDAFDAKWQAPE